MAQQTALEWFVQYVNSVKAPNKKYINHIKTNQEMKIKTELTDKQIELIADLFSKREQFLIPDEVTNEWILSHAFQLGAKFYRDFKQLSDESLLRI